jgi:hypothetical protein
MRLWSINPSYLDARGLVALWRESLLAQKVLQGKTNGYKNHPQLIRFKNTHNPVGAIANYLRYIVDEADSRGYNFNRSKIINNRFTGKLAVTSGQLKYEFNHLLSKLKERDNDLYTKFCKVKKIDLHPIFYEVKGNIEGWEIIN